jgi:starch phosphorylase
MQSTASASFSYQSFPTSGQVAYFSMEIAINPAMPTYSGGLGILAGDTLRSMADLGVPLVAFSLVHRKGYFQQLLDSTGMQSEEIQPWNPSDFCTEEKARVTVSVEDRVVTMRCWRYDMVGCGGHVVPIYLLDTDLEGNSGWDRGLTDHLYGGDTNYRLQQEIVLGMGGVRMAHALGYRINVYHMNEGHAALLTLGLLERQLGGGPLGGATEADMDQVRKKCVFTTHTPVPAGHDRFSTEQTIRILGGDRTARLEKLGCFRDGMLNMTLLALRFSRYANGVCDAARQGFPRHVSGVSHRLDHQRRSCAHLALQAIPAMLDKHIPAWRRDNLYLRNAIDLPEKEILTAHAGRQGRAARRGGRAHRPGAQSQGAHAGLCPPRRHLQARHAAVYRSQAAGGAIATAAGGLQILYAGKAHPQDQPGKALIQQVVAKAAELSNVWCCASFTWKTTTGIWARMLTAGVDVWVNTPSGPTRPREPAA